MVVAWSREPPPLWKAVIVYYAAVSAAFALLGIIGGSRNPLGALTGLGILMLSHMVLLAEAPHMTPSELLGIAVIAVFAIWLMLKLPRSWWRIGFVLAALLAWLGAGLGNMSHSHRAYGLRMKDRRRVSHVGAFRTTPPRSIARLSSRKMSQSLDPAAAGRSTCRFRAVCMNCVTI